ncbi:hypothetical protein SDC9_149436 [bioreactor metagenome]|uniref:Uncharacterized protein n=1 Tax=bioreactor metagenome TaxID=1076179 RepID=A0A645ELR1_9ZZZZ
MQQTIVNRVVTRAAIPGWSAQARGFGGLQVVAVLQIEPELIGSAEVGSEAMREIGGNAALAVDEFADLLQRQAGSNRESSLRDAQRNQQLFHEDFPGVDRGSNSGTEGGHRTSFNDGRHVRRR